MDTVDATLGKSILLYLIDGNPDGIIHAEIRNWTGKLIVCNWGELHLLKKMDEPHRPGLYIIEGADPKGGLKKLTYIGEGDDTYSRLKAHTADDKGKFADRCVLIVSKDENLTKAHTRYLESRLIGLAKAADRVKLLNGTSPDLPPLPDADKSDMEYFLRQIELVLPVLGFHLLQQLPELDIDARTAVPGDEDWDYEKYPVFYIDSVGVFATMVLSEGRFLVITKSTARVEAVKSWTAYVDLRNQLFASGSLKQTDTVELYEFSKTVEFNSPSAAASVVLARNANGPKTWKNLKTGQTYKAWQEEQLKD
ncbi:MAG: GIY-YIG nuclease family protein [Candidatus Marinimicrobia bacterium]|nr:GIY-YIG nuclease family protein [Candidatus Neomarinimicrobiota bacterium]